AAAPAIQRAGEAKETRRESCLQPNPKTLPTQAPFRPLNESGYNPAGSKIAKILSRIPGRIAT
ncbi:hypothetical protein, partial [Roseiarcus sp.]|uniref:hypothetical protein n=1 Tax=Roseiarcus sp. TaxID=1969460 RepID=UPI003F9B0480